MGFGSMALLTDPTEAVVGLWSGGSHIGWEVVDEPGAVVWTEHMSHDQAKALAFYDGLFGYDVTDLSAPDFAYASVGVDGETVRSGIGGYGAGAGEQVPAAWTVYFQVRVADDAAARVAEPRRHGGQPAGGHAVRPDGAGQGSVRRGVRADGATGRAAADGDAARLSLPPTSTGLPGSLRP